MLQIKNHIQQLKTKFQTEDVLNTIMFTIILVVIVLAVVAARHPVSSEQFFKIQKLSLQQSLPDTQNMAHLMLMQDKITVVDFYRLMHAQHYESSRIHTYPAEEDENK